MRLGLFIAALLSICAAAEDDLTRTCKALQGVKDQQRVLNAEIAADALRHQADLIELRALPADIRADMIKDEREIYQFGRELNAQLRKDLEDAAKEHRARALQLNPAPLRLSYDPFQPEDKLPTILVVHDPCAGSGSP